MLILMYFLLFGIGIVLAIGGAFFFISMFVERDVDLWKTLQGLGALLISVLFLVITVPSLKYIVTKDFDVVSGKCTIDVSSSGRTSDTTFNMVDKDEQFLFNEIPELDAYGKAIPYYCEITVTKDHMWEMDYKIYDLKTRKLVDSHTGE